MSKRDLKKYLAELNKIQLEEQILELYEKFVPVTFKVRTREARLLPNYRQILKTLPK